MIGLSGTAYLWIKAFHIIAVIAWMAGLLYLPRLFVYHTAAEVGSDASETFKVMERRLLRAIMNPAMMVSVVLGVVLLLDLGEGIWTELWVWAKLILVAVLIVLHMLMGRWRRDFAADANRHSQKFYRIVNEAPTVAMIGIVIFVVVKPV